MNKMTSSSPSLLNRIQTSSLAIHILSILFIPISPALAIPLVLWAFLKFSSRANAVISSALLGLASAFIVYPITYQYFVDMERWALECIYYQGRSITAISTSLNPDHQKLLVWNLWCWIIGNSGNLRLLQSSAAFFGYAFLCWPLLDMRAREEITNKRLLIILLISALAVPIQGIVGNVRSTLSCIIVVAVFYCQHRAKKRTLAQFFIIICTIFIHSLMLIPLLLWMMIPIIKRFPRSTSALLFFLIIGGVAVSDYVSTSGLFGEGVIGDIFESIRIYSVGTEFDQEYVKSTTAIAQLILLILLFTILTLRLHFAKRVTPVYISYVVVLAGMQIVLVNVGSRLQTIPLLLGFQSIAAGQDSERYTKLDRALFAVVLLRSMIDFYAFAITFNWLGVLSSSIFWPLALI